MKGFNADAYKSQMKNWNKNMNESGGKTQAQSLHRVRTIAQATEGDTETRVRGPQCKRGKNVKSRNTNKTKPHTNIDKIR